MFDAEAPPVCSVFCFLQQIKCFIFLGSSLSRAFLLLVVTLLHRSVLPQVVERLQLPHHVLPPGDHGLDLLRVLHRLVLGERRSKPVPEVITTFGVLPAEVEELWRRERMNAGSDLSLDHPMTDYF